MKRRLEKAALYARVSTKDGRQDTENQLIQLREYCANQGWEIAGEYVDHETGGTSKRLRFQQMFVDASRRKFDLVLVWALDRLTREGVAETFEYIKRLTTHGVQFVSFREEHFRTTGPAGELMIAVAAWIAEQERVRRSERAKAAIMKLRREGRTEHLGRPRKVVDHTRAQRLRAEGWSLGKIAAELGVSTMMVYRRLNPQPKTDAKEGLGGKGRSGA